jgi:N-glycosylase/DNA lyase
MIRRCSAEEPGDGPDLSLGPLSDPWRGGIEPRSFRKRFHVRHYDLNGTLDSGQAFRWELREQAWEGVLQSRWVRLSATQNTITTTVAEDPGDWGWLEHYLQLGVNLETVLAQFPFDEPLRLAVASCRGLRLLRQDPWECLASFILSSTKQIVQIKQIIRLICERFGEPVVVPPGRTAVYGFPSAERLARVSEVELRACKMGFRAPYLRAAARTVAEGKLDLRELADCGVEAARDQLLTLHGVGRKIADCVLLFAYGYQAAFPVDVWVNKALQELYFPGQRVPQRQLESFSRSYFGSWAGYAQQYLFHYMRIGRNQPLPEPGKDSLAAS